MDVDFSPEFRFSWPETTSETAKLFNKIEQRVRAIDYMIETIPSCHDSLKNDLIDMHKALLGVLAYFENTTHDAHEPHTRMTTYGASRVRERNQ